MPVQIPGNKPPAVSRRSCLITLGLLGFAVLAIGLLIGYGFYRAKRQTARRMVHVGSWLTNPQAHPEWAVEGGTRCGQAPFLQPTSGLIGFLYDDSWRIGHRHQGLDIFGGGEPDTTPVYAAYSGFLTRLPDWKSSLILRIPADPLQPGRQIWLYYTHMAGQDGQETYILPDFPPGTSELPVEAGTLLGYQGNYSGNPLNPVGVHLHFSVVLNGPVEEGYPFGKFRNELDIRNTLDPSPYLGMELNAASDPDQVPICSEQAAQSQATGP